MFKRISLCLMLTAGIITANSVTAQAESWTSWDGCVPLMIGSPMHDWLYNADIRSDYMNCDTPRGSVTQLHIFGGGVDKRSEWGEWPYLTVAGPPKGSQKQPFWVCGEAWRKDKPGDEARLLGRPCAKVAASGGRSG